MSCPDRYFRSSHVPLVCLLLATALLAAPAKTHGGQAQDRLQKNPWSVYSWGLYSNNIYHPPSCHELSYFSGSPLRFDLGGELGKWKRGSFDVYTKVDLLGVSEGHRIYQVVQYIPARIANPQAGEQGAGDRWPEIGMKRLLVERRPKEFCMIFEEEGRLGPTGEIVGIDSAQFDKMAEPVLRTYDLIPGTGGYTIDGAWTFDHGVPVSLLSSGSMFNDPITQALKEILPQGCWIRPNRKALDLENLRFLAEVSPTNESGDSSNCGGTVRLELRVKNHRLVVEDKEYTPQ